MGGDTLRHPGTILVGSQGAEGAFGGVPVGVGDVAALLRLALRGREPWLMSGLRACDPREC